ncbi:hypothetical protein EZS27_013557 [termite gut metagenome]|uniref:DNA primase n=1 Tax=termite gut metagenome TaxID=433724 RepID=A0A5J4RXG0_9ZZZZ
MNYNQPYLEKYTGKASRRECPKCHDKHSFACYLDGNTGEVIHRTVGRCNHESACGYHYTPKEFFIDNPKEKEGGKASTPVRSQPVKPVPPINTEPDFIPFRYVEKSASYQSAFVYFLCGLFDLYRLESPTIERLMSDYALGATKEGGIIFWQIDTQGRVRTGKIMRYDKESGHRIKESGGINWVHSLMKKQGLLPDNYNMVQCLFGEHLLRIYPDKVAALVESEKSALIASGVYPDYVWLATGGKSQLSTGKLKVLRGRTVIMFPDVDGYDTWKLKAKELEAMGCRVIVSDLLEKKASPEDRANKIDVADWLIRQLAIETVTEVKIGLSEAERVLHCMETKNPVIRGLIEVFGLELINN